MQQITYIDGHIASLYVVALHSICLSVVAGLFPGAWCLVPSDAFYSPFDSLFVI
jgi:hypothetical protein